MTALTLVQDEKQDFVTVASSLFGEINVRREDVIQFPSGLLGFPECRNFALIAAQSDGTYWLQSTEHPVLVFLLVDPFIAFHDYVVDLAPADLASLRVQNPADVAVLAIVTLSRSPEDPTTANLQGPLAINMRRRIGKQVALDKPELGLRCPVDLRRLAESA